MCRFIFETDYSLYTSGQGRLDWSRDYAVGDLSAFFIAQTKQGIVYDTVVAQQAKALGCKADDLAATLTPNPSDEVLGAYANGLDYLAAKHILLKTYDPQGGQVYTDEQAKTLAQQIINAIDQNPTYQQFENLMALYGGDPGMQSYPEGYLFTKGEMVEEFENAVRELEVGGYSSEPVKSAYGYHVILRLDPAGLTQLKTAYQQAVLASLAQSWTQEATVTANDAMLGKLDVRGCYEAYFNQLQAQAQAS